MSDENDLNDPYYDLLGSDLVGFDVPAPDTVPIPGTATLDIEDKCEALFFSATWTVIGKVGKHELSRSDEADHPHSASFIRRWTRHLIRQNKDRLRRFGVDVPATYLSYGGVLQDLED